MNTKQTLPRSVVHLELHLRSGTGERLLRTAAPLARAQVVRAAAGSYLAFDTGGHLGKVVECGTRRPLWLLTSRSTGSTGPPSARVSSEHSCCWNRERDRRDGAASSRALKQGSRAWEPKR